VGRIAKLLSFLRTSRNDAKVSEGKIDTGGGANITSEHFSAPGDDSNPLPGDYVLTVAIKRSGGESIAGYIDPKNDSTAKAGEKRIYARDGDGAMIVELWLKKDGSAVMSNDNGAIELKPSGDVVITNEGKVTVNCSEAEVNADSTVINSNTVDLGATGGKGLVTEDSVDPFTGNPHIDGSTIVKAVK